MVSHLSEFCGLFLKRALQPRENTGVGQQTTNRTDGRTDIVPWHQVLVGSHTLDRRLDHVRITWLRQELMADRNAAQGGVHVRLARENNPQRARGSTGRSPPEGRLRPCQASSCP